MQLKQNNSSKLQDSNHIKPKGTAGAEREARDCHAASCGSDSFRDQGDHSGSNGWEDGGGDTKDVMQQGNQEVSGDLEPPPQGRAEGRRRGTHSLWISQMNTHGGQEWLRAHTAQPAEQGQLPAPEEEEEDAESAWPGAQQGC